MTKLGKNNTPPNPLLFHHLLGYSKKKKKGPFYTGIDLSREIKGKWAFTIPQRTVH